MGTTIIVALAFWLASSFIEYKIIKTIPGLKAIFDNFVVGIIISLAIGYLVTLAIGPSFGVGAGLGQILGVATNQSTYAFYDWLSRVSTKGKHYNSVVRTNWHAIQPRLADNKETLIEGAKMLGRICFVILFILALPVKIMRWCREFWPRAKRAVSDFYRSASEASAKVKGLKLRRS